ncbi:MAG: hypothetical protein H6741_01765 [Alphaproteobacteria bacterium]|nr:hypothetical protein [Alphaproteobacteria bacterium]MCB9791429.1 hypothetical protein [Alphaproteobacteria bacterium]
MRITLLLTSALTGCWYEAPVDTAEDYPEAIALSGEVVVADGPTELGPGFVLLYDAYNPPPPDGFGRPLDFAAVTAWGGDGAGLRAGPWALNGVQPGDYLLTTLVDHDGDFNPFWDFAGSATCGDQLGAWVEGLTSTSPAVLRLGEEDLGSVIGDLSVVAVSPLTLERPVSTLAAMSVLNLATPTEPPQTVNALSRTPGDYDVQLLTYAATGIEHELIQFNAPDAESCATGYPLMFTDLDGDGISDFNAIPEAAALGIAEISFPEFYLIYPSHLDPDAPDDGHQWITQPIPYVPLDPDPTLRPPPGVPFLTESLTLVFSPIALHIWTDEDGVEQQEQVSGPDIPAGVWDTLVVNPTGQSWLLPNQLGGADGGVVAAGFEAVASQATSVVIE